MTMQRRKFDRPHGESEPIKTDSTQASLSRDRQQKRGAIVVFDPSPLSLLALAGALDCQGYQCTCARTSEAAVAAMSMELRHDLVVCDVADDASQALETIAEMRKVGDQDPLPAVLIAESRWAGLERKAEAMTFPTRCLFKPIDPNALIAVVDQLLWMPSLVDIHRRKGTRPSRPGWVSL